MKKLKAWFIEWNRRRKMDPFERALLREQEFQAALQAKILYVLKKMRERGEI
jgi:hypothetical protein